MENSEKIAVLENELNHAKRNHDKLEQRHDKLEERIDDLIEVVGENNKIIAKSKGMALGAAFVVSLIWTAGLAVWNTFVK